MGSTEYRQLPVRRIRGQVIHVPGGTDAVEGGSGDNAHHIHDDMENSAIVCGEYVIRHGGSSGGSYTIGSSHEHEPADVHGERPAADVNVAWRQMRSRV